MSKNFHGSKSKKRKPKPKLKPFYTPPPMLGFNNSYALAMAMGAAALSGLQNHQGKDKIEGAE